MTTRRTPLLCQRSKGILPLRLALPTATSSVGQTSDVSSYSEALPSALSRRCWFDTCLPALSSHRSPSSDHDSVDVLAR